MSKYWLMKSEPTCYSIDDLKRDKKTDWDGVRNYQARNFMRDKMSVGDGILFYHSSTTPAGVVGIAKVATVAHPDESAQDKKDDHYDPKATKENPIWMCVDVSFVKKFKDIVTLEEIKANSKLEGIMVAARGSRLSVQPVSAAHFKLIESLGSK